MARRGELSDWSGPGRDPVGDLNEAGNILADLGASPKTANLQALQERAAQWSDRLAFEAISRIAASIPTNLDFRTLIQELLDTAVQAIGGERGILFLGRHDDPDLIPAAARGVTGNELHEVEALSRTLLQQVRRGETVETSDALSDPIFRDAPSVSLARIRSMVCVPLQIRGALRGALYVDNRSVPAAFPEAARRFLEAFAGLASVALEIADLHGEALRENHRLRARLESVEAFGRIVTASPAMQATLRRAALAAQSDAPVMILGESGTGKELLARAIHESSPRAGAPFVAHNCAAVPAQLMESIFFGHLRGAFTGALRDTRGLFSLADGGILFLDEVVELDPALQAKLLRVLEDGRFRALGSEGESQVDVRVITATSGGIQEAVRQGRFREDLYYRANVLEIHVPPLRERPEDIPILVEHLARRYAPAGDPRVIFSPQALECLQTLPWRGNIRELANLVQRALVFSPAGIIGADEVMKLRSGAVGMLEKERHAPDGNGSRAESPHRTASAPPSIWQEERDRIVGALQLARGNQSEAARRLGLERNALLRRMRRLGIDRGQRL
jgi:transcriptional regulator with GAF, ATPase, and Fis domain